MEAKPESFLALDNDAIRTEFLLAFYRGIVRGVRNMFPAAVEAALNTLTVEQRGVARQDLDSSDALTQAAKNPTKLIIQ
jgi:hypothetical protein